MSDQEKFASLSPQTTYSGPRISSEVHLPYFGVYQTSSDKTLGEDSHICVSNNLREAKDLLRGSKNLKRILKGNPRKLSEIQALSLLEPKFDKRKSALVKTHKGNVKKSSLYKISKHLGADQLLKSETKDLHNKPLI
jgi:hypothetical protein